MILGIDLGTKTTGIAISSGTIAAPLTTITHKSLTESVEKISKICSKELISEIVLGFVEGGIKKYFEEFKKKFQEKNPQTKIIMRDETLTSRQATDTMININLPKNKRREREHEIAATIILQSYLDELND